MGRSRKNRGRWSDGHEDYVSDPEPSVSWTSGCRVIIIPCRWPSNDAGAYIGLFRNLAGAIRNGEELAVKWAEATTVIELVELAHQSAREGRTLSVPAGAS
jgi:predicted dehydrogenase